MYANLTVQCTYAYHHANRAHLERLSVFPAAEQSRGREDGICEVEGAQSAWHEVSGMSADLDLRGDNAVSLCLGLSW